jgi:hypothetical protein
MSRVSDARMFLRVQYIRETNNYFEDDVHAYADWLEKKATQRYCNCDAEETTGEIQVFVCNLCGKITDKQY